MTLQEALAIAAQAKPKKQPARIALDKLQGSTTAAADLSAGAAALSKRFGIMNGTIAGMKKRLDQLEDDVAFLQDFAPNAPIRRRFN